MPWYVYLALKHLFPTGKRGSLFFYVSVMGVALGVGVLVVVQSVMGGFGQEHRRRIVETSGHLNIWAYGRPFAQYVDLVNDLRADERVSTVAPYAFGYLLAVHRGTSMGAFAYGVESNVDGMRMLERFVTQGNPADLDSRRAFISTALARSLGLGIGDTVEVVSPTILQALQNDELILPTELEVAGYFEIDWAQQLTPNIIVSLQTMQDLYDLDNRVHGVTVYVDEDEDEFALAAELNTQLLPFLRVQTWEERFADFLWVLDLEKTLMFFILLFVLVLAAFAIAVVLIINVFRKTREVGLLAALGADRRQVIWLFTLQGFAAGLWGTLLGVLLGVLILLGRDPIVQAIATLSGTKETLVQFYFFAYLPAEFSVRTYLIISVFALVLSTAAGLFPALYAASRRPAEALKVEA